MKESGIGLLGLALVTVTGAVLCGTFSLECEAAVNSLFSPDARELQWSEFAAHGFADKVGGVVYTPEKHPCCGVPVGGIAGHIDIDARGVYGFRTIFNPKSPFPYKKGWMMPRKLPKPEPILGMAVGGRTWVLASREFTDGSSVEWCTEPYLNGRWADAGTYRTDTVTSTALQGVTPAGSIRYWGHYPVAELEYETDAPVIVGMRVWSPFLPGDSAASNTPAVVFEVHVRNRTTQKQRVTLAINFPGPDEQEACGRRFARTDVAEDFRGILVRSDGGVEYALGAIAESVRTGAGFEGAGDWSAIGSRLPSPGESDSGASCAVEIDLEGSQQKVVRFLLAWYAPVWQGASKTAGLGVGQKFEGQWLASRFAGDTNFYTHMYAARYAGALDVARRMAAEHGRLLERVLAWQAVIYEDSQLPVWLRDSLVNNLSLIAEDGMWAQARPPLGDWALPNGVFALNESPRGCPDLACIPCDWYGNLPIVFFFPELARTTLNIFKQYQRPEGETAFWLGHMGDLPDLATPGYYWQKSLNGTCYVTMVDRLWQATGDDSLLGEFYESAKKTNTYTMNLRPGPGGVIGFPLDGGMEWFEHGEWAGLAPHMGGLHLAQLRIMERMASAVGDEDYARQCKAWLADGQKAMEEVLWADSYYLNFYDPESGKKSEDVMGYQLDGEWMAKSHGLPGVFRTDRVKTTLQTIKKCNIALTPDVGAANFTRADGSPLVGPKGPDGEEGVAYYGIHAMFSAELLVLAMTYMQAGEREFGLELARKHWENLVIRQRHPWDLPNMVDGKTGQRLFGTDYYQCMMLWALPMELAKCDIARFSRPGELVGRILEAASGRKAPGRPLAGKAVDLDLTQGKAQ